MEQLVPNGSFYMPSGVERKVSDLFYGGVDHGLNGGWMMQNIAPRTTSNFTSFRVGATGLDRIEFVQPLAKVCYNPFGAQGNCQGVPESMMINIDAYYPTGGVSRITEMYLAKGSVFSGLSTGLLFDQPMTATRQNFSGFFVDRYSQVLSGMLYPPGNYELLFYGYDANRNMLEGRSILYEDIRASKSF